MLLTEMNSLEIEDPALEKLHIKGRLICYESIKYYVNQHSDVI